MTIKTKFCSLACGSKNYKRMSSERKKQVMEQAASRHGSDSEHLGKLEFFRIDEASIFMGISKRTLYRVIAKGELVITKIGAKTVIKRSDINKFIDSLHDHKKNEETANEFPGIKNCYAISDLQKKLNISPSALYSILKRAGIVKYNVGWFVYVCKRDVDLLFNIKSNE